MGADLVYLGTLHDGIARSKSGRIFLDDLAADNAIPLHKFRNMNDPDSVAGIRAARLDWLFVIGWSQIAGPDVLSAARNGAVGIHPTLLPRGRGRASVPWAILKGLSETGVTMFQLEEGVDTGPILGQLTIPIAPTETATSLYRKVASAHRDLIRAVFPLLESGEFVAVPQNEKIATEWPGRSPADGAIDPSMSIEEVDRLVRATTRPYPGAFLRSEDTLTRVWSGSRSRPAGESVEIVCRDGIYFAVDFEIEASLADS